LFFFSLSTAHCFIANNSNCSLCLVILSLLYANAFSQL
jgi:hypothetical protein